MTATMTSCTFCVISARLLYKQFLSARRAIDYEDWSLIAAVLIGLPSVFISVFCLTANGMGRDVWGLQHPSLVTTLYYLYINSILYVVLMILIKLSLTFFYLNIFFGRIRILLWATVVFHVISATVYVLGVVFQCLPIGYAWEKFDYAKDEPAHGHCLNINVAGWVNSGISVAADIWLLSLPLSQLHKMRLHWKKKLGATLMFMTGASVTLISCLRLASIRNYATTSNPTWDQWDILWWSTVEVEVGLICICLPTIRLIFIRIAPRIFGSESSSVSYVPEESHA
ncbi:hypothetical protein ISF_06519 [Cordyceps fumosorosea ARSEF 2679]|uniref:Rhodopsin domain-containing protein n=1 Tax=Cordyceps fumosorosea (strain ARSEF 2679) TaxID=1081104 RepID=A0A167RMD0_CORFA|nr:hypothetical protein ISF_06519 [Cordyceps fumosorosea ARSEF 2679]OAA58736.1 hypothetical protein ISF_06519 [Cordyceps fumosorosea ARSEF 2679]